MINLKKLHKKVPYSYFKKKDFFLLKKNLLPGALMCNVCDFLVQEFPGIFQVPIEILFIPASMPILFTKSMKVSMKVFC